MKIFISIKKKWLQHKVYKYTLKYEDALSKSEAYTQLASDYNTSAIDAGKMFGCSSLNSQELYKEKATAYIKAKHFEHLSTMYLNKKLDLDEALSHLNYRET